MYQQKITQENKMEKIHSICMGHNIICIKIVVIIGTTYFYEKTIAINRYKKFLCYPINDLFNHNLLNKLNE